jgi:hypothetical protein
MSPHRPQAKIAPNDPLANRLIEDLIRTWLKVSLGYADATSSTEEERQGVRNASAHLEEFWVDLVPSIVDSLQRAALLNRGDSRDR